MQQKHHSLISLSFADVLNEARKYGLSLFLTHQYLEQIAAEIRVAIFGNVGTIIGFRVGAEDAAYLAKEFYPTFSPSDFILPPYTMYLKLMIDEVTSKAFNAKSFKDKTVIKSYKEQIITSSQNDLEACFTILKLKIIVNKIIELIHRSLCLILKVEK